MEDSSLPYGWSNRKVAEVCAPEELTKRDKADDWNKFRMEELHQVDQNELEVEDKVPIGWTQRENSKSLAVLLRLFLFDNKIVYIIGNVCLGIIDI